MANDCACSLSLSFPSPTCSLKEKNIPQKKPTTDCHPIGLLQLLGSFQVPIRMGSAVPSPAPSSHSQPYKKMGKWAFCTNSYQKG